MGGPSFDNDFIRRRRGAGSFVVLVIVVIFFTPLRRPWPPSTRAAAVRCDDLNNVHVDVPAGDDEVAAHLIAWRRRIVAAPDVHAIFQGRRPVRSDDQLATVAAPDADEDARLGVCSSLTIGTGLLLPGLLGYRLSAALARDAAALAATTLMSSTVAPASELTDAANLSSWATAAR